MEKVVQTPDFAAYDLKALAEGFKEDGLELTEAAAGKAAKRLLGWFKVSAAKSDTVVDDIVVGVLTKFEGAIDTAIDSIDGKVG